MEMSAKTREEFYAVLSQQFGVNKNVRIEDDTTFEELRATPLDMQEVGLGCWIRFDVDPRIIDGVKTVGELLARLKTRLAELSEFFTTTTQGKNAHA